MVENLLAQNEIWPRQLQMAVSSSAISWLAAGMAWSEVLRLVNIGEVDRGLTNASVNELVIQAHQEERLHLLDTQQIQKMAHVAQDLPDLFNLAGILRWPVHQAIKQPYEIEEQLFIQPAKLFPEIYKQLLSKQDWESVPGDSFLLRAFMPEMHLHVVDRWNSVCIYNLWPGAS